MNRYAPSIPRSAFGIAAVALMAVTFSLAVFAPAQLRAVGQNAVAVAAPADSGKEPIEVSLSPSRIEVIGLREQTTANTQPTPPKKNKAS